MIIATVVIDSEKAKNNSKNAEMILTSETPIRDASIEYCAITWVHGKSTLKIKHGRNCCLKARSDKLPQILRISKSTRRNLQYQNNVARQPYL